MWLIYIHTYIPPPSFIISRLLYAYGGSGVCNVKYSNVLRLRICFPFFARLLLLLLLLLIDLTFLHDGCEELEFAGSVEADEIHAPVPAKVSAVEPVPVLELVPRFSPGQEVIVASPFHVRDP